MKIYTGTGDAGETGLYGGQRVRKDNLRVEAYGTVDETNAALGVAVAHLSEFTFDNAPLAVLKSRLEDLQRALFTVGADLATPLEREVQVGKPLVPRIGTSDTVRLENLIDEYDARLEPLQHFILPGGSLPASALHHARTIARRAERCTVTLYDAAPDSVNPEVLRYLNRFADLLFVLARAANRFVSVDDVPWTRADTTLTTKTNTSGEIS